MFGPVRSSLDNDGNAGVAPPTHGGGVLEPSAPTVPADDTSSLPLGATCVGGVAASAVAHDSFEEGHATAGNGLPEAPGVDYPGGSASIKEEMDARPVHEDDGTSAVTGTGGEALSVPCEGDDGDVQLGADSPRPPGASGAPSISDELSLLSLTESAGGPFVQDEGTPPPEGSQRGRCDVRWGGRGL